MKQLKILICLLCIVGLLSGCAGRTEIETSSISVTTEQMLANAPLIFLGKVSEEMAGYYRNENGVKTENGHALANMWITPYDIDIIEVYKGELREDITSLTLSVSNFYSPEDMAEEQVEADEFYLEVGQTALFCATYYEPNESYVCMMGKNGCFLATDEENVFVSGNNQIDLATIDEDIAAAELSAAALPVTAEPYILDSDKAEQ